jgi:hypothetical protein
MEACGYGGTSGMRCSREYSDFSRVPVNVLFLVQSLSFSIFSQVKTAFPQRHLRLAVVDLNRCQAPPLPLPPRSRPDLDMQVKVVPKYREVQYNDLVLEARHQVPNVIPKMMRAQISTWCLSDHGVRCIVPQHTSTLD